MTFLLAETSGIERPVAGADLEMWAEHGTRSSKVREGGDALWRQIVQTYDAGFVAAFGADVRTRMMPDVPCWRR